MYEVGTAVVFKACVSVAIGDCLPPHPYVLWYTGCLCRYSEHDAGDDTVSVTAMCHAEVP